MEVQDFWHAADAELAWANGRQLGLKATELLDLNLQLWKLSNILTTCSIKLPVLFQTAPKM